MTAKRSERLSGAAARRPILTVTIVLALAVAGGILALHLKPSAGIDTFVSRASPTYRATAADQRQFGADPVVILIREPLTDLVQTRDLVIVTRLEACLGGQYVAANNTLRAFTADTAGRHPPFGGWASPCGKLMRYRPAQVVYGPGTFLNTAVAAVNSGLDSVLGGLRLAVRAAEGNAYRLALGKGLGAKRALAEAAAAGQLEYQSELPGLEQLALSSGLGGLPSIDDPSFIRQVVFDPARGPDQPKARFAYLFPSAGSALIQVRLRSSLSDARQAQAISWIRQAVRMPIFRLAYGGGYVVSGLPVVVNDLAGQITAAIAGLLLAALVAMAATLLIVFGARPRLLPLGIALAATGITFGLLAILGATLTMASIAVLPILIGLAVDYSIQFQARAQETGAVAEDEDRKAVTAAQAVTQAAGRAAPTLATAALATGVGFLVLALSPVPMVRSFGLLLVAGIAIALVCALSAGAAGLVLAERGGGRAGNWWRGAGEILSPSWRGAREIVSAACAAVGLGNRRAAGGALGPGAAGGARGRGPGSRIGRGHGLRFRLPGRAVGAVVRNPGRVLALAAVLAVAGWIADTQLSVQSDVTKLVPASMPALHDLRTLEKVTGVSGEIDVAVRGSDAATPQTVRWMIGYENQLLTHYGYREDQGCAKATLCPALSLPDLFSTASQAGASPNLTQSQIDGLLAGVPPYFSQAVITPDHREATLAFGIRLMALSRQEQVIGYMRSRLHPPRGVSASLTGLPVLAAQANAALSSTGHRFLTLIAGLLAVGLVLLVVLRSLRRALIPMIPIVLATGWSSLILWLIGIPLNPMSAALGTLVIAISTEFSVLLSERFGQERAAGHGLSEALGRTYRLTGAAVLASGITAIAGFGVLIFSDITMLRDFGFVTLVDLSVSLGGVLLVLPAVLALSERREALGSLRWPARVGAAAKARVRRRPRVA